MVNILPPTGLAGSSRTTEGRCRRQVILMTASTGKAQGRGRTDLAAKILAIHPHS
jgi:hypothetical protein